MTRPLRDDLEPHDADELLPAAERLQAMRPVPRAAFRGDLRRALVKRHGRESLARPSHLWARVSAALGSGALLLTLAAAGVAGGGPFAA